MTLQEQLNAHNTYNGIYLPQNKRRVQMVYNELIMELGNITIIGYKCYITPALEVDYNLN